MTIFGTDTSRYQPLGSYDPGLFEIVNVEEPDGVGGGDFTATVQTRQAQGIPVGGYLWVHPGQRVNVERAIQRFANAGVSPTAGFWLDYEEAGCEQWQVDDAYAQANAFGVPMDLYTYLFLLPTVDRRGRRLWLAYYPGNNDGSYDPSYSDRARAEGATLHQFTSSANAPVGLDRNVVLDDAWYYAAAGGAPIPAPPLEVDMPPLTAITCSTADPIPGRVWGTNWSSKFWIRSPDEWTALVNAKAIGFETIDVRPDLFAQLVDMEASPVASRADVQAASSGGGDAPFDSQPTRDALDAANAALVAAHGAIDTAEGTLP